jgi:hypothetical protein
MQRDGAVPISTKGSQAAKIRWQAQFGGDAHYPFLYNKFYFKKYS